MTQNDSRLRANVPMHILASLRDKIMRGELVAGERLPPERELAKTYQTNRTSLREALKGLEAQGLVTIRQGDGVRVVDFRMYGDIACLPYYFASITMEEKIHLLAELMSLRTLLLPEVVNRCVINAEPIHFIQLHRHLTRLKEEATAEHLRGVALCEVQMYRVIVEAGHSQTYLWVWNTLERTVGEFLDKEPRMWAIAPKIDELWGDIVDALESRNLELSLKGFHTLFGAIEKEICRATSSL